MNNILHTQYGKATGVGSTYAVKPFTDEDHIDIVITANQHGNLRIKPLPAGWLVEILNDDDSTERSTIVSVEKVDNEIRTLAIDRSFFDVEGDGPLEIDLGQLDPWDLGMAIQIAAFGEYIVG